MNILNSLQWRYATKKFDNERILPEEKIHILTEAFNLTATSYGLQPLKLIVIHDKELQGSLVAHSMGQRQVADSSHLFVICIENSVGEDFIQKYFENVKKTRATEDSILNPYKKQMIARFSTKSQEEITAWSVKQAYLTLGNLLTVCATEEIDACPMEGFVPESYDKVLELDAKGLKSVLVLPVGYRAKDDQSADLKKVRRPIKESVIHLY